MLRNYLILLLYPFLLLCQGPGIYAQESKKVFLDSTIKQQINAQFKAWDTSSSPGATIAVIHNGEIVYKKAYGSANLEFDIKNSTRTLFNIASNSKQFTTYAILQLQAEGKLSLKDDIRKYLPELPDFGATITVQNLAQHTHGMRGVTYLLGMAGWHIEDVITRKAALQLLKRQKELNFTPGTNFSYNNSGYILLAELIERIVEKPFHEYLSEIIFTPLQMNNTVLLNDYEKVIPRLSNPYYFDGETYKKGVRNFKDIVGNTGIRTNVEDLSKWVINFENHTIGNNTLFKELASPVILENGDRLSYALGQVVSTYKGKKVVSHGGADAGYRSQILRFVDHDLSIIVLTNDGSLNADEKAYKIADLCLGNNSSDTVPENTNKITSNIISDEILKKYEGKFELQPGFIMEFNEKDGTLYVTATGQGTLPLETIADTEFKIRRIGAVIRFITNDNGDFDRLNFTHEGRTSTGTKITYVMDQTTLLSYTGQYYSEELKTMYDIRLVDDHLVAYHHRQEETILTPLNKKQFSGNTWFFGKLDFSATDTAVQGFKVSSDRVQNLWFRKVSSSSY